MEKFIAPKDTRELVLALKDKGDKTYIVAGGTDLCVKVNENLVHDFSLIDISNTKDLKDIKLTGSEIIIGASVVMSDLIESSLIKENATALWESAKGLGSTQIRNRATIGGNVSNAAQCADTLPVLFSYGSLCEIINSKGEIRRELVEDLILDIGKTSLKKDEAIIRFIIPTSNDVSAFTKVGDRKAVTISKINCCMRAFIEGNLIKDIIVYMGSIGPMPIRAKIIENSMKGEILNKELFNKIKESVQNQIEEAIPNRPSKYYKRQAALGIIEDGILKLIERGELNNGI